jgi:lipoyl(octanoyl) transferase
MKKVNILDLGTIDYFSAFKIQETLFDKLIAEKTESNKDYQNTGTIILCEHPHVYTLGKSGFADNLLINEASLKNIDATFYKTNRGGDITYHGPGQLVCYPILNLETMGMGLKKYIDALEEVIIKTLALYGIRGDRLHGATGVWIDADKSQARKIAAIGVKSSKYITMHGFALNVDPDLTYFSHINPCGFIDKGVTSVRKETGNPASVEEVKKLVISNFSEVFDFLIEK